MSVESRQFLDTSLKGVLLSPIKASPGFDSKLHNVPDKFDDRGIQFVANIATGEIEKDIEIVFRNLRKTFKFKSF